MSSGGGSNGDAGRCEAKAPTPTADSTLRSQSPNTSGPDSTLEAKVPKLTCTSISDIATECAKFFFHDTVLYVLTGRLNAAQHALCDVLSRRSNSDLYSDTGFVDIGEEGLQFTVHKGLICRHSSYFRGAFEGGFIESQRNRVELREESVKDFALFLAWLYTGRIPSASLDDLVDYAGYQSHIARKLARLRNTNHNTANQLDSGVQALSLDDSAGGSGPEDEEDVIASLGIVARTHRSLVDLYIFADRRGIAGLQNSVITNLAELREEGYSFISADPDVVDIAFSSLPTDSPLCRFLIDEAAWCWTKDIDGLENLDHFPGEFNAGLVRAMLRKAKKSSRAQPDWRTNLCLYYDHSATPADKTQCRADLEDWNDRMANKVGRMAPVIVSN